MDENLARVRDALIAREPIFHRPGFGATPAEADEIMAVDYFEIGASGRRYDRAFVLAELKRRAATPREEVWEAGDFACRALAPDVFLLTYRLAQDGARVTRRATIWERAGERWRARYHQGTLVSQDGVEEANRA
jgi:hypothetical protein